jgi:hypothetical protein
MDGRQPSGGAEGDRDRGEPEEDEGPAVRSEAERRDVKRKNVLQSRACPITRQVTRAALSFPI